MLSKLAIFDGSLESPWWLIGSYCPKILDRWLGPTKAFCRSVNVHGVVVLFVGGGDTSIPNVITKHFKLFAPRGASGCEASRPMSHLVKLSLPEFSLYFLSRSDPHYQIIMFLSFRIIMWMVPDLKLHSENISTEPIDLKQNKVDKYL